MALIDVLAATATDDVGMPPRQSLAMLLSTESLIFAAFSVTATLALPTKAGRSLFYAQGWFAYGVVGVLFLIAVAGGFALYATVEPDPPDGFNEWARTCGIALGLGVQPFLACAIAHAAKRTNVPYDASEDEE